ncbi:MAG: PIN domain nuclease [Moraxellaceae bacterium]|nr:PIN domain nuclease [Moraxellaceae bacterium]
MSYKIKPTIVDTSVWIDYFNGKITAHTDMLETLLQRSSIAITDVIMMEILQGFRYDRDYNNAKNILNILPCYEILGKDNSLFYAELYRELRKKGITIRKSNDVMIAGFCIKNNFSLLFDDKDFLPFVEHLDLSYIHVIH